MVSITANISSLSQDQRESVANFILTFPVSASFDGEDEDVIQPTFSFRSEPDIDEEPTPEAAFSAPEPAGPVLVPAPAENNDRLDKSGIPWDERIHASSRAKNADGSWRAKRGVDDATVAQVEGELKGLMAIPAAPAPVPAAPAPVPAAPVEPIATTVMPPAPAADDRAAFVNLIARASSAIGAKTLTQEELTAAVNAVGVPSLPLLANRLDLVPQVTATVEAYIASHQ